MGMPIRLQFSITNFVPLLLPSQNASTKSAFSMMVMFHRSGAPRPYLSKQYPRPLRRRRQFL